MPDLSKQFGGIISKPATGPRPQPSQSSQAPLDLIFRGAGGLESPSAEEALKKASEKGRIGGQLEEVKQKARPLPAKVPEDLAAFDTGLDFMKEMLRLKNKGFGGKPVDTGPLVGWLGKGNYLPAMDQFIQTLSGLSEHDASTRTILNQMHLETLNPKRKTTTGAQAGEKELSAFIMPLLPGVRTNDPIFNRGVLQAARNTVIQKKNLIKRYREAGFNIPKEEESVAEKLLKEMEDLIPEKHRDNLIMAPFSTRQKTELPSSSLPAAGISLQELSDEELLNRL